MKKIIFMMMVLPSLAFGQIESLKSKVKKQELTINAFELVIGGVLPINYERFIDNNQSITVKTFFFDKHYSDFNSENNNLFSLQTQYNFYFSEKEQNAGFFLSPFLKFTKGKQTAMIYDYTVDNNGNYVNIVTKKVIDVNALIAGFGLGYKFLWKDRLSFTLSTDIGRVLNQKSYYYQSGPIDFRAAANIGIRF